jgi:glutamate-5-semialdehyde dehydrogenase
MQPCYTKPYNNIVYTNSAMQQPLDIIEYCILLGQQARSAATQLNLISTKAKNGWLLDSAEQLLLHSDEILGANAQDVQTAPEHGLNSAAIDRLTLTAARIRSAAEGMRQVAALPDPVGEIREGGTRPNGLQVLKVGVPLGVIFFLYESRPNVTVDAAALCLKSGNAVILRGGKEAIHSNTCLHRVLTKNLTQFGIPEHAIQLVSTTDREAVGALLKQKQHIDLTIPRGGESLIRRVSAEATMPVLKHYQGNCHVYVDKHADLQMAANILVNAKCQRPGVCNAAESLIVHADVATDFLLLVYPELQVQSVELRGCPRSRAILPGIKEATEQDFAAEYLELILSVVIVDSLDAAVEHISRYGSQHTEAIITRELRSAQRFTQMVDASAVVVNASTRFNDGFELGLGAEIGISTDKFHARGPCGLRELTTYKYIITGDGQIRQ